MEWIETARRNHISVRKDNANMLVGMKKGMQEKRRIKCGACSTCDSNANCNEKKTLTMSEAWL